jgi:F-type H+-transporting ATPase subunit epsilon
MRLKIFLPTEILVDVEVLKVSAEAENGAFTLLPRHIDFTTSLTAGILSFINVENEEEFVAVDEGILVKCGSEVRVSTRNAIKGTDLGTLMRTVEQEFQELDEQEKSARSAFARMEADLVRRFIELEQYGHAR